MSRDELKKDPSDEISPRATGLKNRRRSSGEIERLLNVSHDQYKLVSRQLDEAREQVVAVREQLVAVRDERNELLERVRTLEKSRQQESTDRAELVTNFKRILQDTWKKYETAASALEEKERVIEVLHKKVVALREDRAIGEMSVLRSQIAAAEARAKRAEGELATLQTSLAPKRSPYADPPYKIPTTSRRAPTGQHSTLFKVAPPTGDNRHPAPISRLSVYHH